MILARGLEKSRPLIFFFEVIFVGKGKKFKKIKVSFVDSIMKFQDLHPEKTDFVNMWVLLPHSDAIEIRYFDGSIEVWDPETDFLVTVKDPVE